MMIPKFTNPYSDMLYKYVNTGFGAVNQVLEEPRKVAIANYERARERDLTEIAQLNRERAFANADRAFDFRVTTDSRDYEHLKNQDEATSTYRNAVLAGKENAKKLATERYVADVTYRNNMAVATQNNADRTYNSTESYRNFMRQNATNKLVLDAAYKTENLAYQSEALKAKNSVTNNPVKQAQQLKLDELIKQQTLNNNAYSLAISNSPRALRRMADGTTNPEEKKLYSAAIMLSNEAKAKDVPLYTPPTNRNALRPPKDEYLEGIRKGLQSNDVTMVDRALQAVNTSPKLKKQVTAYANKHDEKGVYDILANIKKKHDLDLSYYTAFGRKSGWYADGVDAVREEYIVDLKDKIANTPVKDRGRTKYRSMVKDLTRLEDAKIYNKDDSFSVARAVAAIARENRR